VRVIGNWISILHNDSTKLLVAGLSVDMEGQIMIWIGSALKHQLQSELLFPQRLSDAQGAIGKTCQSSW
jgi:hypothetical protein